MNYMELAYLQALQALKYDEVPIGAVLVSGQGDILAAGHNEVEQHQDPSLHAELVVIRRATKALGHKRLLGCSLYVTLEPCAMCAQLISHARISKLIFGAFDAKSGGILQGPRIFDHPTCHHKPEIKGGMEAEKCGALLSVFFQEKRLKKRKINFLSPENSVE